LRHHCTFYSGLYCPEHKVHMCNDHAVQSYYWYATPVRWIDYLGKVEMLTKRYVKKFVAKLLEKSTYGTFLGSFISARETWDQHFTCCVHVFVQCRCSKGMHQRLVCCLFVWRPGDAKHA
jgi:hypothetical protein